MHGEIFSDTPAVHIYLHNNVILIVSVQNPHGLYCLWNWLSTTYEHTVDVKGKNEGVSYMLVPAVTTLGDLRCNCLQVGEAAPTRFW